MLWPLKSIQPPDWLEAEKNIPALRRYLVSLGTCPKDLSSQYLDNCGRFAHPIIYSFEFINREDLQPIFFTFTVLFPTTNLPRSS
jgi:hypothetical protein